MFWFAFIMFFAQLALGEIFRPKPQGAGDPADFSSLKAPTASEARKVPMLWGTTILESPNLLWTGDFKWVDISEEVKTGLIGTHKQIVGYSYYLGMFLGLCQGKVEKLLQIRSSDKVLFNGSVVPDPATGTKQFRVTTGEKIGQSFTSDNGVLASENGLIAICDLLSGSQAQPQNRYLSRRRTSGLNTPGYRNISSLVIHGPNGGLVDLSSLSTPIGNPTDPVPPASQATWDLGARITRDLFYGLGGGSGNRAYSGLGWSGNIGTNPQIGNYAFVLQRCPTALMAGTTHPEYSYIQSVAAINQGDVSMAIDPGFPAAGAANKGWYFTVTTASPGKVSYLHLPAQTKWLVGDRVFSNGRNWKHYSATQSKFLTAGIYQDANPAEIIFELATDAAAGAGIRAEDFVNMASLRAAAATLWAEGFGMSGVMDTPKSARDAITEVCRYIDATFYQDIATGEWNLKLIRADYDVDTLPVINLDTIVGAGDYSRSAWDETTNEVKVQFTDNAGNYKTRTVAVQDLANISIQGNIITSTVQYPWVTRADLANRLAERDLRALSLPLARISGMRVNRKQYALQPGDVFKLKRPDYGIDQVIMRVTGRREGELKNALIEIDAIQDVFSLGDSSYSDIDPGGWEDPTQEPSQILVYDIKPAPYHFTQDGAKAYILALAEKPSEASINFNVFAHAGGAQVGTPLRSTSNIGNGSMGSVSPGSASVTEVIYAKATSSTSFDVVGSVSGSLGAATVGTPFTSTKINFTITAGVQPFVAADTFAVAVRLNDYGLPFSVPLYTPTGVLRDDYPANSGGAGPTDPAAVDTTLYDPATGGGLVITDASEMFGLPAAAPQDIVAGNKNLGLIVDSVNGDEIIAVEWPLMCNGVSSITRSWSAAITDKGILTDILVADDAPSAETWTLACTVAAANGGTFSVTGSVSGAKADATVGTEYDNNLIAFTINDGVTDFVVGDTFTLTCNPALVGVYYMNQVWRGLLNTTARPHAAGSRLWMLSAAGVDTLQFGLTDAIKAKYGDISTLRPMRLDEITDEQSMTFSSEPIRPYPPGDTRINGLPWPVEITGAVTASWVERNRLTQLTVVKQDEATIAPESGTTYTVKFYRVSDESTSAPYLAGTAATWTLFKTYSGITAGTLSQLMSLADEIAAVGIGGSTRPSSRHRMELRAVHGGLDSEHAQVREYDCAGADMLADEYADG